MAIQTKKSVHIKVREFLNEVDYDAGLGICLHCGEVAEGVEPDARNYPCESCGEDTVYGAEELLMMFSL